MANVTDHANAAAAVAAGWAKTQVDYGASVNPRFLTRFERFLSGAVNDGDHLTQIEGQDNASAAAADTQAVAALNAFRRHYYGGSPGRASGSAQSPTKSGNSHGTIDSS